ncbi:hypothetical protein CHS0354_027827 [Potamilus streckersoni]|uniref:Uncharacterized protein n=1 Tax=Potamilus streckersoni TaxID=2493646 RepID=A0AAE0T0K5_9BIVA|nr:hypothetical protein CHS0354_027827 [Potamilus streckersoni]
MFEPPDELKFAKPVLVLVDDLSQADISLNDLYGKIHFMYLGHNLNTKTASPVCVLLKCVREEDFSMLHAHDKINEEVTVLLRQKLEEKGPINEKEWCENKYHEIEKTGQELGLGKYKPEHLIAFMILRSNFNLAFVSNTIEKLLRNIDPESNQFKLLKYASLLFSYVESHNEAIDIHIPLECCDQLMANTNILKARSPEDRPWEYLLHEPVKILLRIEDKQRGSGRQIKMAHQNLARQVLECIKNKTKQSTVSIALEYLKSDLLNNYSYAKVFIHEMTKEMLIRRKKEEYDDMKNTKFSPLVEDMLKDSSYQEVAAVLVLGYEQLKDGMIAQQLARVYIHVKEFEMAKTWADTARSIAPQRFGFIHTCGLVMREKFSHLSKKMSKKTHIPSNISDQISLIEIAFQAIDIFNEATRLIMKLNASSDLLIYADTIDIILQLLSFVSENVEPFKELSVLHNYLVSPDFIPEELPEEYGPLHNKFKALYEMGESAFRHVEDLIFCHTTIYERKHFHTKERKEHRSNRNVKFRLPDMQSKFSNFFGEKGEDMKEIYTTDPDLRNRWYRGKLLGMKANSFIKIFDIIALIKKKKHNKEEAKAKLLEAKEYLKKIMPLSDCDLANKISLNVALALLRAPNRESTQSVFAFCKELIDLNGTFLDVAYLFIMIILWPNKENMDGVDYDDKLFHRALRTLGDLYNNKKEQMLASKPEVLRFKQEHNIFRATTQFFLIRGKGLQSVCHRSTLFVKDTADLAWDELWDSPPEHLNLMLLSGIASSSSKGNFIIVLNNKSNQGDTIKIRNSYKQPAFVSEERVTFYLGFSFEGLVAYGVKANNGSNIHHWNWSSYTNYEETSKEELYHKMRKIEEIKAKREKNLPLHPDEQQLLQDEEDISDAMLRFEEQFD